MLAALQKKDWKAFARLYNGPAYAQNRYDEEPSKAYSSFNRQSENALLVGKLEKAFPVHLRYIIQHLILRIQRVADQIKVCFISTHSNLSVSQTDQSPLIYEM